MLMALWIPQPRVKPECAPSRYTAINWNYR